MFHDDVALLPTASDEIPKDTKTDAFRQALNDEWAETLCSVREHLTDKENDLRKSYTSLIAAFLFSVLFFLILAYYAASPVLENALISTRFALMLLALASVATIALAALASRRVDEGTADWRTRWYRFGAIVSASVMVLSVAWVVTVTPEIDEVLAKSPGGLVQERFVLRARRLPHPDESAVSLLCSALEQIETPDTREVILAIGAHDPHSTVVSDWIHAGVGALHRCWNRESLPWIHATTGRATGRLEYIALVGLRPGRP